MNTRVKKKYLEIKKRLYCYEKHHPVAAKKIKIAVIFLAVLFFLAIGYAFRNYPFKQFVRNEMMYRRILWKMKDPSFASTKCDISQYGAVADGKAINTEAFAKAIEDCSQKGGGIVFVPDGKWLAGPIHLKSNINLNLSKNAQIIFSTDRNDYLPKVLSRYQGMEYYNFSPLIYARDCENIGITGKGTLIGNGQAWRDWAENIDDKYSRQHLLDMINDGVPVKDRVFGEENGMRPSFIQFVNSKNILVEDIRVEDGPMWTIHPIYSENVHINNVDVRTQGINTDGVDIDSSKNVLIENSYFNTGDDAIALKSGLEKDGIRINKPSEGIVVRNCTMETSHSGVAIGSELTGGIHDVVMTENSFLNTDYGIRIKSLPGRGGAVQNVWIDAIKMVGVKEGIYLDMYYGSNIQSTDDKITTFANFYISNIDVSRAADAIVIDSYGKKYVKDFSIYNVHAIDCRKGVQIKNTTNVWLNQISVQGWKHPEYFLSNNSGITLINSSCQKKSPKCLKIDGDTSGFVIRGNNF